jgi:type I restriction enzyme S subunit
MKSEWPARTLSEIAENLDNKRVPITKAARTKGDYPYYGASGIVDYVSDYIFEGDALLISEDGANLLARSTPIAFPASGKYWVNNHAHILKFKEFTSQRFVELFFESISVADYVSGAAQPKLNQRMLNSIPIPFPAMDEQRRIVATLDQAFEAIDTAKACDERNIVNARVIFKSCLEAVLTDTRWPERALGDVCERVEYGSSAKSKAHGSVPVLRMGNIQNGGIDWEKLVYSTDKSEIKKYLLDYNDVLFNRTNSPELVGKTAIFKSERPAIFAGYLIRIAVKKQELEADYLNYFLNSSVAAKLWEEGRHVECSSSKHKRHKVEKLSNPSSAVIGSTKNIGEAGCPSRRRRSS